MNGADARLRPVEPPTHCGARSPLLRLAEDAIERHAEVCPPGIPNCGKPYLAVLNDELPAVVDCFRFFAGAAQLPQGPLAGVSYRGHTSMIRRDPIGWWAASPPLELSADDGGLEDGPGARRRQYSGGGPPRQTRSPPWRWAELASAAPGVINIVCGRAARGACRWWSTRWCAWCRSPVHRHRPEDPGRAPPTMKRTHLELGGKAPVIIFDDADLRPWWPAFAPSASTTPARIAPPPAASMPRGIYDKFVAAMTLMRWPHQGGRSHARRGGMGPLISDRQRNPGGQFWERAQSSGHGR